ncbi:hypothetical protein GWK48_09480 [Metallosphaera tengchongensis]|uniref:SWIM-type domain-containing protein n=1 Tax=Metallosphaera tengchongensis TaxID=1532350 RepID=A0A6N0NYC4_9CREN|nr:hypothetical protein [Metallosphaera tengchongensis]QKR00579.1 hypothetical protein GWK48_09480 [Metallosphaera tengchongensis]
MIVHLENGKVYVEGVVPAKCSLRGYRVKLELMNNKIVGGSCECGLFPCSHSSKLYLRYMRSKGIR